MEAPMSASLGAMGSLLRKLHVLLTPEYQQLIEPVKDGIELLLQNLEVVKAAMVDLSETETPTKMAHHWMNQVRDLSYEIEDYIDNTMYSCSSSGADSESIGGRIGEFGVSVREARERHEIYELGRRTSRFTCASSGQRPGPAPNWKGTKLFGVGSSKTELINKLTDDAVPQFKVVPILGVGGVGKTALAKQVFHELRGRFECRAFVQASRIPDTKRLLRGILSQVRRHSQLPADCCTVQDLIDNIRDHIQDKRYLIVIDDLWETSSWDIVSSAFPKGDDYCRILTTTNIEEVALECCDYQYDDICKLKPLSRDDSANLFLDTVFGSEQNCSEQLKEISSEIVRNCGGLPLGIISIARLLANEMEDLELWHHVKKFLCFSIATNHTSEDMLRNIVCLSYRSLPRHLKTCLQYLTMYPEGCIIWKADLVKQWSAEGFIRETEGEDTNAVAGSYFDELVSREMVQPIHKAYSDEVFSCTVHHMVFDVIKEISIEENFTTALDYSQSITKLPFKVRRLSLHVSNTKYATKPAHISLSQARSVAFYGLAECLPSTLEFKQLRVLILEFWGHQEEYDLSEISRLCQLRYVQVTTDMIVQLPATIRGLQYLETLQLDARVANVPSDIVYLQKLLHFRLRDVTNLDIGHMVSLRTLESFDLSNNSEENVWGLGEMTNLQDLHLNYSTELSEHLTRNLTALASSLGKFGKLRTLTLSPSSAAMRMYMDCWNNVSSPPLSVQRLELLPPICIFSRLPEWIGQLKRLCILKVVVRELLSSDVHSLTMLQELTVLSLDVLQPTEEALIFYHKAFPVLKYFKFRCGVLRLAFQKEAMPNLQKLKIEFNAHRGEQYGDMLIGIEHLLNLQDIIGRIGAAMDAEESDKMAAESALSDATNKHSRLSRFNIRRIEWVEEKISQISDVPGRSSSSEKEIKQVIELKDQWLQPSQLVSDPLTEMERQRSQDSFPELVKDEDLVGIEDNRRLLTEWLYTDELDSKVIAVLGMGGVGKTTLVTNVYEREKINFSAHAWIVLSQTYTVDALLRKLLRKVGYTEPPSGYIDTMDVYDLKVEIKRILKGRKCLIVLDDVWDQEAYFQMHDAFQNDQGSRVIITTRRYDVAALASSTCLLVLQPLSDIHAFDLFCRRAFYNIKDHECPTELVKVAKSIVDWCQGLPLAIVSIGCLLSSRSWSHYVWNQAYNQLRSELSKNNYIQAILNMSYHDLSGELRNCFLYCSLFPEDYPLSRESLVRLWTAEGFALAKGNNTPEAVAEGNLMELIYRNMLQVTEYDELGRVNTCGMHDIMRDLALSAAKEEKFGFANDFGTMVEIDKDVRRLSSYRWEGSTAPNLKLLYLRTIVSLGAVSSSIDMLSSVLSHSSYLTVLELQDSEITQVPASIGNLFNLRYIGLRRTKVKSLPDSVEKLSNLQTLDMKQTKIEKLPRGITKIKKLRHLLADRYADEKHSEFRYFIGMQAPKDLSNLKELQTLETVEASKGLAEQLKKLMQLRSVWIDNISSTDCASIFVALSNMPLLSSLLLSAKDENESLCFEALKPRSTELHRLIIRGQWAKGTLDYPIFRSHSKYLKYLALSCCHLGEDPLGMLASHLSNLTYLRLNNMHSAKTLVLDAEAFPHLKTLVLKQMSDVNQIKIMDGALPCIEGLYIVSLPKLNKVPQGIESLSSLKKLWLTNLHKDFKIQWNGNGMRQKMLHVAEVRI